MPAERSLLDDAPAFIVMEMHRFSDIGQRAAHPSAFRLEAGSEVYHGPPDNLWNTRRG